MKVNIFQDWEANKGNFKGQLVVSFFRFARFIRGNTILTILFLWYLLFYRIFIEWILGIELHWNVKAGSGLRLEHGHAVVINGSVIVGKNCIIRQSTTIGNIKLSCGEYSMSPTIGDNVDIGCNVCILGPDNYWE